MRARVEDLALVCVRRRPWRALVYVGARDVRSGVRGSARRAVWRARARETCGLASAGARDELSGVRFNLQKKD